MLRSAAVTPVMVEAVLAELPPLISEGDMHVSQMALSFLSTLALTHPASLAQLSAGSILPQLITLVRSPLLQGGALAAMLDFYQVESLWGGLAGGRDRPRVLVRRRWLPRRRRGWATWTCCGC